MASRSLRIAVVVSIMVICSGCLFRDWNGDGVMRVACIGDSNSTPLATPEGWCEFLAARHPGATWLNFGVNGARAIGTAWWYTGDFILTQALAASVDLVIIALGTNDLCRMQPPEAVFDALTALAARSEAAGIPAVIATIPPIFNDVVPGVNEAIEMTNALINDGFAHTVDFHDNMTIEDLTDGVHMALCGQVKRAAAVEALLFPRPADAVD